MKSIREYIRRYFLSINKNLFFAITLFTAGLVFINYQFGLDEVIRRNNLFTIKLLCWWAVFLVAFLVPYWLASYFSTVSISRNRQFFFLILFAPLIFSLKISLDLSIHLSGDPDWNNYWNHILYWPGLLVITGSILFVYWRIRDTDQPFYGITTHAVSWKPYWVMLLIMLPLIAVAAAQPDFQAVYPKLHSIAALNREDGLTWGHQLLFELAYGTDFIGIELFFRGLLVLGFIKWAGKDAILPMACFYCTIHFGKPLGECISSYFGGLILGIIVYNTRSILGGLLVHLGIAWMMELAGFISNSI